MSSAGIVIAPMAVVAAAGAALLLTGTGAALIAIRGANMAADAAQDALDRVGASTEVGFSSRDGGADAHCVWELIAAEVAQVNARIAMLSERLAGAVTVALPNPLSLAGCTRAAAAQWVGETTGLLRAAQQSFETAFAADEVRRTLERLDGSVATDHVAAVVTTHQRWLTALPAVSDVASRAPADQTAAAVLGTLDPEANELERRDVLAVAAVLARHEAHSASSYLAGLQQTIGRVNTAVARRRIAALRLAAFEAAAGLEPRSPLHGTVERLRAVVAGEEDLTPALRIESARAAELVEDAARRGFLLEAVRERLAAYGCAVQTEYDMEHSASLRITREEWSGEHFADVWVADDGNARSELLRRSALVGGFAAARERRRCLDHNAMMRAIGTELGADVDVDDTHQPEPVTALAAAADKLIGQAGAGHSQE